MKNQEVAMFLEKTRIAWQNGALSNFSDEYEKEAINNFETGKNSEIPIFVNAICTLRPRASEWLIGFATQTDLNCIITNERLMLRRKKTQPHDVYELADILDYNVFGLWTGRITVKLRNGAIHVYKGMDGYLKSKIVFFAIGLTQRPSTSQENKNNAKKENGKQEQSRSQSNDRDHPEDLSDANNLDQFYSSILGINGAVNRDEIKKNYRLQISKYHPDKIHGLGVEFHELAERKSKEINQAYTYFCKKYKL